MRRGKIDAIIQQQLRTILGRLFDLYQIQTATQQIANKHTDFCVLLFGQTATK